MAVGVKRIIAGDIDIGVVYSSQDGSRLVILDHIVVDHQQHLRMGERAKAIDFVGVTLGQDAQILVAGVQLLLDHIERRVQLEQHVQRFFVSGAHQHRGVSVVDDGQRQDRHDDDEMISTSSDNNKN